VGLIGQLISFSCICSVAGCARFEVDTAQTEINCLVVCDAVLFDRDISVSEERPSIADFVLNCMASLSVKQSSPSRGILLVNYNMFVRVDAAPRQQTALQTKKSLLFSSVNVFLFICESASLR
jgi:hypothetical protein